MKKIAFLGCGWLGQQLAVEFIKLGYKAIGSTSSADKLQLLAEKQIIPVLWGNPETEPLPIEFTEAQLAVISFPPSVFKLQNASIIRRWLNEMQQLEQVFLMSSTSVYSDDEGYLNINSPVKNGLLIDIENQVLNSNCRIKTVFRLAGLWGYDRPIANYMHLQPCKYFGNEIINLVTAPYVLKAMIQTLNQGKSGVFNLCSHHFTKKDFYLAYCKHAQLKPGDMPISPIPKLRYIESSFTFDAN
jgi:hypothetical protein